MNDLKKDFLQLLKSKNVSLKNLKMRYITKSIWQQNRYRPETIKPEIWVYNNKCVKSIGFLVDYESFYNLKYRNEIIEEVLEIIE